MGTGETTVLRAGSNFMKCVAKFVKQRFDVGMRHERRFVRARRRKVAEQRGNGALIFSVRQKFAADDWEFGEVVELSFARKHVEIKHAKRFAGGGVGHHVELEIVDPFVGRVNFLKLQTEDALINVEHSFEYFLEREKVAKRFGIDIVFLFLDLVAVVAPIPEADLRVRIVRVFGFHLLHLGDFGDEFRLNAFCQIIDVLFRARAGLGHFDLGLVIVPRFVTEPESDLVAQINHLVEHGAVRVFGERIARNVELFAGGLALVLPGYIGENCVIRRGQIESLSVTLVAGFDSR